MPRRRTVVTAWGGRFGDLVEYADWTGVPVKEARKRLEWGLVWKVKDEEATETERRAVGPKRRLVLANGKWSPV
jgi:hypothetical protein